MDNLPSKIRWNAPEHEFHEKNPEWYWALGIITAAMVLAAVVLHNFLFAVFTVLAGFSVGLYGARRPRMIVKEIRSGGVSSGNRHLNYDSIDHFWIYYDPPVKKELILESKKTFSAHTVILLGKAEGEKIRRYLLQYLKEKKIEESLVAVIARALKF